jgi:hypothetical protein
MSTYSANSEMSEKAVPMNELIESVKEVLAKGKSVELPATGYSMFPTLKPDDRVLVKPILKNEMPVLGSVVVFRNDDQLIIHRLIRVFPGERGEDSFEARGDSRPKSDKILPVQQLIGLAVSYKRKNKEHKLRCIIPGTILHKFNRFTLWFFIKIRKLTEYFKL